MVSFVAMRNELDSELPTCQSFVLAPGSQRGRCTFPARGCSRRLLCVHAPASSLLISSCMSATQFIAITSMSSLQCVRLAKPQSPRTGFAACARLRTPRIAPGSVTRRGGLVPQHDCTFCCMPISTLLRSGFKLASRFLKQCSVHGLLHLTQLHRCMSAHCTLSNAALRHHDDVMQTNRRLGGGSSRDSRLGSFKAIFAGVP